MGEEGYGAGSESEVWGWVVAEFVVLRGSVRVVVWVVVWVGDEVEEFEPGGG